MSKLNKIFIWTFVLLMPVFGKGQNTSEIIGKMKKGKGTMVFLHQIINNKLVKLDSCNVNFMGKFKLKTEVKEPGFYQLTIDSNQKDNRLLILKGEEKIKINTSKNFKDKSYKIEGSVDNQKIQEYEKMKSTKGITKDSISNYATQFVKDNAKSLAVFIALNDVKNIKESIIIAEKGIGESYPNTLYHTNLKNALTQIQQREQSAKAQSRGGVGVGAQAPELNMPSPDGKIVTLASLRGKYVLIDFWASWCGPCRRENPNVVALYNKYKDQGFDVYSVSLDKDKARWQAAIKQDKLIWPNHVSDLKGWGSAATKIYGFRGIPYTVLLDKEGKIIATRLRGVALDRKLEEIFGK